MVIADTENGSDITLIKEIERKAFHLLVLLMPVVYHVFNFSLIEIYTGLAGSVLFLYVTEFFRKTRIPGFRFVSAFLDSKMRKEEKEKIAGYVVTTTNFLIVALVVWPLLVMDESFFLMLEMAIVIPLLGDIAAALSGKWAKRNLSKVHFLKKEPNKTFEGLISGILFTAALAAIFIIFWGNELNLPQIALTVVFLAATVAFTDYLGELPLFFSDNIVNCWIAIFGLTFIYFLF
ncbi:MAG: phosphatidate cytidylyltransferase [Candidatus Hodarchaeales archaeon]